MKIKILVTVVAVACAGIQTFGQGTIRFNNRVTGLVDAPVSIRPGREGIGTLTGAMAQLYLIPLSGPPVALTPATTFRTSSPAARFYVTEPTEPVVVQGAAPGTTVYVQLRAWVGGPSYEQATSLQGVSNIIPVKVGGRTPSGPIPDGVLIGLQGFSVGFDAPYGWFNSIRVAEQGIVLNVSAYNSKIIIQSSSDLLNWQPILTNPPVRTDFTVPFSGTNGSSQFFRMHLEFALP
jgi:hypothetical protein